MVGETTGYRAGFLLILCNNPGKMRRAPCCWPFSLFLLEPRIHTKSKKWTQQLISTKLTGSSKTVYSSRFRKKRILNYCRPNIIPSL